MVKFELICLHLLFHVYLFIYLIINYIHFYFTLKFKQYYV